MRGGRNRPGPAAQGRRSRCWRAAAGAAVALLAATAPGWSQTPLRGFAVSPVSVEMQPGQRAAVITVRNSSEEEVSFQVRPFAWDQATGSDHLEPTQDMIVSPPLGTLPAGASQVVRLVMRRSPEGREGAYRIWLDQIPRAAAPSSVNFTLRLSIPVFVEPPGRLQAHLRWSLEQNGSDLVLAAVNEGTRRDVVRGLALAAPGGTQLGVEANVSPYVLAGATRRWRILAKGTPPGPGQTLHLTAQADAGAIDVEVPVVRAGP